ncbi:hypothetical protein O3P69_013826 [Scylla paramamosain]|uniref:Uncharacterized protein n=1 Tax=Scylla paramamosain TaxID=85552 RepID=A0AAW0STA2_SCYPA
MKDFATKKLRWRQHCVSGRRGLTQLFAHVRRSTQRRGFSHSTHQGSREDFTAHCAQCTQHLPLSESSSNEYVSDGETEYVRQLLQKERHWNILRMHSCMQTEKHGGYS